MTEKAPIETKIPASERQVRRFNELFDERTIHAVHAKLSWYDQDPNIEIEQHIQTTKGKINIYKRSLTENFTGENGPYQIIYSTDDLKQQDNGDPFIGVELKGNVPGAIIVDFLSQVMSPNMIEYTGVATREIATQAIRKLREFNKRKAA